MLCVFWYVDFQGKMVCFVIDFLDVFDYFVDVRVWCVWDGGIL